MSLCLDVTCCKACCRNGASDFIEDSTDDILLKMAVTKCAAPGAGVNSSVNWIVAIELAMTGCDLNGRLNLVG
jgi:hypothetical protein